MWPKSRLTNWGSFADVKNVKLTTLFAIYVGIFLILETVVVTMKENEMITTVNNNGIVFKIDLVYQKATLKERHFSTLDKKN